jgi:tetratricopeptide (TPR) repeat protein
MCPNTPYRPALILGLGFFLLPLLLVAQSPLDREAMRSQRHEDPQWDNIQQHLLNPTAATPKQLENQGDLLRVRRFPEDAMDYYNFAIQRGGTTAGLLIKLGLTELELHNVAFAESYFRRAVKLDKKNAEAWNNLAAAEHLQRQYGAAVGYYKRAVKLDKAEAIFHVNLSTAYFEVKDFKNGRKQAAEALKLDPMVYQHGNGVGITVQVLTMEDRARFAYEMAKLYAQRGKEEEMLHSLSVACENGLNILALMAKDPDLAKYRQDPRVALLVMTAKSLHEGGKPPAIASTAALSPIKDAVLPASTSTQR